MDHYPLLDLRDAHTAADNALEDLAWEVERLSIDSDGQSPPGASQLLADIAALRGRLGGLFSPALHAAIAEECARMDEDANRWEPSG